MEKRIELEKILEEIGTDFSRLMHYGAGLVLPTAGADKWDLVRGLVMDAACEAMTRFEGWIFWRPEEDERAIVVQAVDEDHAPGVDELSRLVRLRVEAALLRELLPRVASRIEERADLREDTMVSALVGRRAPL